MFEDVYYNYSFYGDNKNTNNDINDADNLTWTWSHSYSHRVDVTTGDVMRENSYNQWENSCNCNLTYADRTSTSIVLGIRGNKQSDQFDSLLNVDVGSKCTIDLFSGRNGNRYNRDMHFEVQLHHRVEDEVEPDGYDDGISLRSACISRVCKSSLDKAVF